MELKRGERSELTIQMGCRKAGVTTARLKEHLKVSKMVISMASLKGKLRVFQKGIVLACPKDGMMGPMKERLRNLASETETW